MIREKGAMLADQCDILVPQRRISIGF